VPVTGTRSALSEPTTNPPAGWVLSLTLLNLGIMSGWFGPIQVLLAEQAADVSPGNKEGALSLVLGCGAFVSAVSNPVFGALSDRTRSARGRDSGANSYRGRRLPWILGGSIGGACFLGILSVADSLPVMVLAWCGVQAALNAMYAAMNAAIPDQVPVPRRGLVGGLVALAQTLGVLVGIGIATVTGSVAAGYLTTLVVLLLLTIPYAVRPRDIPLPADHELPPLRLGTFVRSFWISPRAHPDFAWAWATRFLVNVGNAIATTYLLYFVTDGLGVPEDEADGRVLVLTGLYAAATIVTTVGFGHWSDRIGRRKVFVIWSGMIAGAASLILAVPQNWPAAIAAATVLGLAYGIFVAVDFAMITQVLPNPEARAKDLGVINLATSLPQVIAPTLCGLVLVLVRESGGSVATQGESWSLGYGLLYGISFAACLLGAVFVIRIRGVR
jgi:MFS family permease